MLQQLLSKDNPRVKDYCKLNMGKQMRRREQKFTLEGTKLCREALLHGVAIDYAFITPEWAAENAVFLDELKEKQVPLYEIGKAIEGRISDLSTPQGVFCVCEVLPQIERSALYKKRKILALYDIQDPGNLGTMVRSADAFGFDAVVLSKESCDLFSPKVLRSAMGSVFHLPYHIAGDMDEFEQDMAGNGLVSAAAVLQGADLIADGCNLPAIHLLYIGNEGNGLPQAFAERCSHRITLAMKGKAESLNAATAAGILMWELSKQEK